MRHSSFRYLLFVCLAGLMLTACSENEERDPTSPAPEPNPALAPAVAYIQEHLVDLGMRQGIDRFRVIRIDDDNPDEIRVLFNQYYYDVRVYGGELTVFLDENLEGTSLEPNLVPDVEVDLTPTFTDSVAYLTAEQHFIQSGFTIILKEVSEMVVLRWVSTDRLCYRYEMSADSYAERREYFVDAHNSGIVTWNSSAD